MSTTDVVLIVLAGEAGFARCAAACDTPTVFSTVHRTVVMPFGTDLFESRCHKKTMSTTDVVLIVLAGEAGFEPTHTAVKVLCLTA